MSWRVPGLVGNLNGVPLGWLVSCWVIGGLLVNWQFV